MITKSYTERSLAKRMRYPLDLRQLSEPELTRIFQSIELLQEELQAIPSVNENLTEAVVSTQKLLRIWSQIIKNLYKVRRLRDTNEALGNWDNEGGNIHL